MLALTLQLNGFDVGVAENGAAALAAVEGRRPCLMVLDLVMPGIDGREVLARLRTSKIELPVVIISALDATPPDDVVATLRKPFETAKLLSLATRYCACRVGMPASSAS